MIFRIRSDWFGMAWIFRLLAIPLVTSFPTPNNGFHFEPHSNNQQVQSLFVPRNKSCTDDARGASIWIGDGHRLQQRCHHHPRHLLPHRVAHVPRRVCRSVWDLAKLKAPYGHYRGLVCVVYHVCALEARGIIWPLLISISWVYTLKAPSTTVYSSTSWTSKETFVDFLSELELSWADHVEMWSTNATEQNSQFLNICHLIFYDKVASINLEEQWYVWLTLG